MLELIFLFKHAFAHVPIKNETRPHYRNVLFKSKENNMNSKN